MLPQLAANVEEQVHMEEIIGKQDDIAGVEKKHVATIGSKVDGYKNGLSKIDGSTKVDLASQKQQKKINIIGNFSKQLTIMEKEHFDDDKILHIPIEIEHIQQAQSDNLHTEELAKEAAKVGEQVEHVDALNEHVIGYHIIEEESVIKIKHVPSNMENHKESIDDFEHF